MSLPAHHWTAVATTKMTGISQSMVSMYSGTYISPIRPRPVGERGLPLALHARQLPVARLALVARIGGGLGGTGVAAGVPAGAVGWWRGVAV